MLEQIKKQIKITGKSLLGIYGMTSFSEQKYFQSYAREEYSGIGEIVDLGSWLGSTTIPLAKGLRGNKNCQNKRTRIHAFDRFIWESWMAPYAQGILNQRSLKQYKPGDSFLDEFKRRIQRYSNSIEVYPGDLCQVDWSGKGIEFLLIDAMKSWTLASVICWKFFPALIPGKSLVLHQDFGHYYAPWIHLITYRFRDYFDFYYDVPHSASVVLKYKSPLPPEKLEFDYSFKSFTEEEAESAFAYCMKSTRKEKHASIAAARIMFFAHQGEYEKAKVEVEQYINQGYKLVGDLKQALEFINIGSCLAAG